MALLQLKIDSTDARVRLALGGELDIASAPELEAELARVETGGPPAVIVFDLRDLEFVDSTGLRVLVSADARAREEGRRVVIVRGPEAVHRIFSVTRLDERLEIADDLEGLSA
ncbi:MAG: STAS domain-containing protein [Solirubrobacteraceae bacterium]